MPAFLIQRKYRVLLAALVLLIVLFPLLHRDEVTRVVLDLLFTSVFLTAVLLLFRRPWQRWLAGLLALPSLVGLWTDFAIPGPPRFALALTFHGLAALFMGFTLLSILDETRRETFVTTESVCGVFGGYLLLGLAFGHLHGLAELFHPGSYQGAGLSPDSPADQHFSLVYFSFVTLTTVGYGDIAPTRDLSRGLAIVEAILGQFYIAVLLAELVGKRGNQQPDASNEHEATAGGKANAASR